MIVVISHSLASAPSLIVLGLLIQLVTGFSLVLNVGIEPHRVRSLALPGITITCEELPSELCDSRTRLDCVLLLVIEQQ